MISIVIPAYNEENSINETVKKIKDVLKENKLTNSEIIVVDDGSTDKTGELLKKLDVVYIKNPKNMGYGYSLKRGIKEAKNETIIIMDADLTYPVEYIPELLKKKEEGFDLVIGKRTGKFYKESFFKSFLRTLLRKFVEYISSTKIEDINSGFRVFDKSTIMPYFNRLCNTFSFTTSLTLNYVMNSLFVTYVDIPYNKRTGKSKVKLFKDSVITMEYILESAIYYKPLKVFSLFSFICIMLSIIGFICSHFFSINAGYILGIGGLLVSIVIFAIGLLSVLLKQIMDK